MRCRKVKVQFCVCASECVSDIANASFHDVNIIALAIPSQMGKRTPCVNPAVIDLSAGTKELTEMGNVLRFGHAAALAGIAGRMPMRVSN